jgi:hypothetical protein
MKRFGRIGALVLTGGVVLGGLTLGTGQAHAMSASLGASGGPGVIWVSGEGFSAGASIHVEALSSPNLTLVTAQMTVQVGQNGSFGVQLTNRSYIGPVWVAADTSLGTIWAQTVTSLPPSFTANGTGQDRCGAPVGVEAVNFQPASSVRVELLNQSLEVLSWATTTADGMGDVSAWPGLSPHGYAGPARIAIDETPTPGTGEAAPATLWDELNVC